MAKKKKKSSNVKTKKTNKKEQKNNKKNQNEVEKKEKRFEKPQFLAESEPYRFSASFLEHNGKFSTIVQMYVRPGSNRHMTFIDVMDFIPTSPIEGVQIFMLSKDTLIKEDEKRKIIRKNTKLNKKTIENSQLDEEKTNDSDASIINIRRSELEDYNDYELLLDSEEPIVVFQWLLLIIGDSEELVDQQIEDLNTLLKQNHEGATWSSLPGEQLRRFTNLFSKVEENRFEMTSTSSNYSGLNLNVSSGLKDEFGLPIGDDVLSLVRSTAFFDFEKYTQEQAIIAAKKGSYLPRYTRDNTNAQPPAASIAAQFAANNIVMEGHRAHHIVLNKFDYFESGLYYRPKESVDILQQYDVSKVTLNPMQGFGNITEVTSVFDRLVNKIVNLFNILVDLELTKDEKALILKAVRQFYENKGYWRADADKNPYLTHIVDVNKPETYATMGLLVNDFTTLATQASRDNREMKADRLETLESTLAQALTTYTAVLGRPTSIRQTTAPQVYYNFKNIDSVKLKQIQFINLIEYVIYTAKKGDVIVIHGFDSVLFEVASMAYDAISAAINKGIKFIYAFDIIESSSIKLGKLNDMFEMKGLFYSDLDADLDWSFIGQLLPAELVKFKELINTNLGLAVEKRLQEKTKDQFLVHRRTGSVNNFVRLNMFI